MRFTRPALVLDGLRLLLQDGQLAREMQELFASPYMRVNNTSDVIGVEICGALKNVLAIAAGIVEGLDLGNNAMAALVTQVTLRARVRKRIYSCWFWYEDSKSSTLRLLGA